ncbi:hypothetical protein PCE1_003256 [Barthelona sp. PCE]
MSDYQQEQYVEQPREPQNDQYYDEEEEAVENYFESNFDEEVESFEALELEDDLYRGIVNHGFEVPSKIQKLAILPIMAGLDVIAQAQSGTGKTGTFSIAALANVDPEIPHPQIIIVSPVRELAEQTYGVIKSIGAYMDVEIGLAVGGCSLDETLAEMRKNPKIICCTPGRLFSLIDRRFLNTDHVATIIVDEADEMLSQGFREQIWAIFHSLPKEIQVVLVSATMPQEILELTQHFMRDPARILVKKDELTLDGIRQFYVRCQSDNWKFQTFLDLYKRLKIDQAVVFCNRRTEVENLAHMLDKEGFPVIATHGKVEGDERRRIMRDFREGRARLLVTTDLLSRGIDVQHVSLVFNYDLPAKKESYIHRIGRSGRFGRKGFAINLTVERDVDKLTELMDHYDTNIETLPNNIEDIIAGAD